LRNSLSNLNELKKLRIFPTDIPLWNHECPGVAHVELKRLIQKIVDEVLSLPESLNLGGNHSPGRQQEEALPYFDPKKYEELLATAVINKVIEIFDDFWLVHLIVLSAFATRSRFSSNVRAKSIRTVDIRDIVQKLLFEQPNALHRRASRN
jgi:hypothetical protein